MKIVCAATGEKGAPETAQRRRRIQAQRGATISRTKQASQEAGSLNEMVERCICIPSAIMTMAIKPEEQLTRTGHIKVSEIFQPKYLTVKATVSV